jgi:hypothetical protein
MRSAWAFLNCMSFWVKFSTEERLEKRPEEPPEKPEVG